MKRSVVVWAAGTVLTMVAVSDSTMAWYSTETAEAAGNRLLEFGIIRDDDGDLGLANPITRATEATLLVRAAGQYENALLLNGSPAYSDTASHPWASGQIAMFKALTEQNGYFLGYPDGSFAPDLNATVGHTLLFVSAVLGIDRDYSKAWPYSLVDAPIPLGIYDYTDANLFASMIDQPATHGIAYYIADAFMSAPLEKFDGQSYYELQGHQVPEVGTITGVAIGMMVLAGSRRRAK